MVKKKIRKTILLVICMILVLLPVSAEATVYDDYKSHVNLLAKCIRTELNLGGGKLVKGITITPADQKEWNKIAKTLRRGLYGDQYDYITPKKFKTREDALGYIDTVVGKKYRYLELMDVVGSWIYPYDARAMATKTNKISIDCYIRDKASMYEKLNYIYKREIEPYKERNVQTRLAVIITYVANYLSYNEKRDAITNNLAYTIKTRAGLCSDYAFMVDYFLRRMGFKTRIVGLNHKFNKEDTMGWHSINAVKINDGWFYIDPTNMDIGKYAIFRYGTNTYFSSEIDYVAFPGWKVRCVY